MATREPEEFLLAISQELERRTGTWPFPEPKELLFAIGRSRSDTGDVATRKPEEVLFAIGRSWSDIGAMATRRTRRIAICGNALGGSDQFAAMP